jgi:PadR family transcriptional regulator, regulatory protein PadR
MAGLRDRTYVGYTGPWSLSPLRPMTRRTLGSSTILVLQALARGFRYGFDVMDATELPSGTVYPILSKLEAAGLARAAWEDTRIARREKRPPRRYYEITAAGATELDEAMQRLTALAPRRRPGPPGRPSPAHG